MSVRVFFTSLCKKLKWPPPRIRSGGHEKGHFFKNDYLLISLAARVLPYQTMMATYATAATTPIT